MEHLSNLTDPITLFSEPAAGPGPAGGGDGNSSDSFPPPGSYSAYAVVWKLQTAIVPVIFILGMVGNLLAMGCFLSQSLRSKSCCLYMAAKCVSDSVFLSVLFVMWLLRVQVDVVNVQGVCQLTVFLSYVSGFVSVWLVLAITYENYIRIRCPCLTKIRCTRRVALTVIASIVIFAVVFYSFALWTTNLLGGRVEGGEGEGEGEVVEEKPLCMALVKFKDLLMAMTIVDTVITLVLPSLIIVPLVVASFIAIFRAYHRKSRLHDSLLRGGKGGEGGEGGGGGGGGADSKQSFQNSLEAKVAKFLLSVSLTFLLLHTPGHLIRLKMLVSQYILHHPLTMTDATLQRLFETLYYFNFGCSIIIFLASGANFRGIFISMYCRRVFKLRKVCAEQISLQLDRRRDTGAQGHSCENQAFDPRENSRTPSPVLSP